MSTLWWKVLAPVTDCIQLPFYFHNFRLGIGKASSNAEFRIGFPPALLLWYFFQASAQCSNIFYEGRRMTKCTQHIKLFAFSNTNRGPETRMTEQDNSFTRG